MRGGGGRGERRHWRKEGGERVEEGREEERRRPPKSPGRRHCPSHPTAKGRRGALKSLLLIVCVREGERA